MSNDLKDILSNLNKDIEQDKLLDYLNKKLSATEAHELEKQMADDEFMNDAVEGLEQFSNVKKLPLSVEQLNRELQKQIAKKKGRKAKRKLKEQPWVYLAIILLLILTVVCYIIIKKRMAIQKPVSKPAVSQLTRAKS